MATSTCPVSWACISWSVIAAGWPPSRIGRAEGFDEGRPAVGVQVVEDDEARADAGPVSTDVLQRRELVGPAGVVDGVEAEVDDVGAGWSPGREGAGRWHLRRRPAPREAGLAGAVHGDDLGAVVDELFDDEAADLAGAEHDVAGHDLLTFVW